MRCKNPFLVPVAALVLAPLAASQSSIDDLSSAAISSLRTSIVESIYRAEAAPDGALEAANPAQEMRSRFELGGVEVSGSDWSLGLSLEAWGRASAVSPAIDGERIALGRRVEYRRDGVVEWYVNDERGLEQGFTVEVAPEGDGPLVLVLSIDGGERGLAPLVLPGGRDARFTDAEGNVVLHYTGLSAWDASGRDLPAALSVADGRLSIEVADQGASYPVVVDPWIATELAKLTASDAAALDEFGNSVAISGDTAVVGARDDDNAGGPNAGSAYVFERNQGGAGAWGEVLKLTASDAAAQDRFGWSVALSGDTAVVGAYLGDHAGGTDAGSAYVYGISFSSEIYCTAGTSASGCQASISAAGTASATATSGFVLMASGVEGSKDGLFFYGTNGRQANPWGNGTSYQCVIPPVKRGGLQTGSGTPGACDGMFSQDLNARWCPSCPKPNHNPGVGAVTQAQFWYRDPQNTSNQTTSLSNAIEFLVVP